MAEGELPDIANLDPLDSRRQRRAKPSFGPSRASCRRQIHGDPRAGRRPRHCRLHVLGFFGSGDPRRAFVSQQSHRHETLRRQHQHLGRRRHPLQTDSPFDGEGMCAPTCATGRERRGQPRRLCTRDRREDEALSAGILKSARSRQPATASPCRTKWARCQSTSSSRSRKASPRRRNDRLDRTRHTGHALVVHPRSRSLREDHDRHDPRRNVPDRKRKSSPPACAISASTKA